MQYYIISAFLTSFTSILLGGWVLFTGKYKKINQIWFLNSIFIFLWSFGLGAAYLAHQKQVAYYWIYFQNIAAVLIPAVFYHFIILLVGKDKLLKKSIAIAYLIFGLILSIALLFPKSFLRDVSPKVGFEYYAIPGLTYTIFATLYFIFLSLSGIILFQSILENPSKRKQFIYMFFAMVVGFGGGGTTFLGVFNIPVPPFGMLFVSVYTLIMSYAIIAHHLMNIDIIIRKTLVFAGLFLMVMAIAGTVTSLTQSYLGQYLNISTRISTILSVLIAILLYDPTRRLLVNLTDNYLFQRKFDYQKLLKDASTGISQIKSLQHLLSLVTHFITMRIRVKNAAVLIYDGKNRYYRFAYSRGYPVSGQSEKKEWLKEGHVFPVRDPLIEYLKIKRQTIDLERIKNRVEQNKKQDGDYNYQVIGQRLEELQAVCVVPSFLSDRLLGILLLGEKKSGDVYTEEDLNVLYTIAQESAIAIENARLYDEQIERARELEQINAELNIAQTKMIRALRDVELANEKLQVTQASLIVAEKSATMVGMAKAIGHEVNNPLSIIMGWGGKLHKYELNELRQILERNNKALSEEDRESLVKITSKFDDNLAKMIKAGTRIDVAVKTLTNLLKDTKGEISPLSLIVLTREAIEATRFSTYEENLAGCKIIESIQSNIIIMGNLEQLIQVFVNLIKNAYEAMSIAGQKNRRIEIKGDVDPDNPKMAQIDFIDNGPGIPPDVLPKIWLQGFSTKNRKDDSIGAIGQGQGLFIVKHMIESIHKGTITAESAAGKGTTFIIRLPLAEGKDVNG